MKEKNNFYGDNSLQIIEEEKLKEINYKQLSLENIYFSLDGHNFFKRRDRFKYKILLIVCFSYLTLYNAFEIVNGFVLLALKAGLNNFDDDNRIATLTINMINIAFILIYTTFTIVKLKIRTIVYY